MSKYYKELLFKIFHTLSLFACSFQGGSTQHKAFPLDFKNIFFLPSVLCLGVIASISIAFAEGISSFATKKEWRRPIWKKD